MTCLINHAVCEARQITRDNSEVVRQWCGGARYTGLEVWSLYHVSPGLSDWVVKNPSVNGGWQVMSDQQFRGAAREVTLTKAPEAKA